MSKVYYKGFNKDLTCRGFQFKEGETYEEPEAKLCKSGFHACERPLDVLSYYEPGKSVYHEVELDDVSPERESGESKVCAKKIKVGEALNIRGLVKAHFDFLKETTTGNRAHAATTGYRAHAATTGDEAHAATTGDWAHAAPTGNRAHAATTGYMAHAATTGYMAHAATTGDEAHAEVSGENSIAASLGVDGKARGTKGSWLVLSEWRIVNWKYALVCVKTFFVDGETIKADTWYKLEEGELVEA